MISVQSVTKLYQSGTTEVAALRGVSLEVARGEFLAIAGPSGSGKTTLLNLIGCLDVATSGEVVIDGQRVSGLNRKQLALFRRHHLGFVFQSFNLIPVLTAYENVSFALSLISRDAKQVRTRTMEILGEVGLGEMTDRRPGELSGGQQQRVAIARALVKEPQIVLADEPTANVDSETGEGLLELMRTLNRQRATTFIFSTHDAMVMDYAARLVRLQDGNVTSDEVHASRAPAGAAAAAAAAPGTPAEPAAAAAHAASGTPTAGAAAPGNPADAAATAHAVSGTPAAPGTAAPAAGPRS